MVTQMAFFTLVKCLDVLTSACPHMAGTGEMETLQLSDVKDKKHPGRFSASEADGKVLLETAQVQVSAP